jgi:tRNA pseudouridine55 synthase
MFGILNLRKPSGPTSRDCVNAIQRLLRPEKVGHAGTLDPLASGVLIVLVGQAVRLTDAVHTLPKQYVGTFQLGVSSESTDCETPLIPLPFAPLVSKSDIVAQLPNFIGTIDQSPPKYSAVWIGGKRAHELAREGKEFDMPTRQVWIESLEVTAFEYPFFELKMTCGTGTYVRSLGRDIARKLGSDAVMTKLVRTSIGPFCLESSCDLEDITSREAIASKLMPARTGVQHWPQVTPSEDAILHLEQGKQVNESELNMVTSPEQDYAAAVDSAGRLRALIVRITKYSWRADKCFLLKEPLG